MPSVLRSTTVTALHLLSTVGFVLIGCASPAASPSSYLSTTATAGASEPSAAKPAEPSAPAHADAAPAPEPASKNAAPAADDGRDGLRKASRPPIDLLTGNNVVYVFNFASSAVGTAAKERCESEADSPPAARECVSKAREKIPVESVRFVKDGAGQYWWVTLNRYKGSLLKWHKIQFVPGKQDNDSVSLNLTGKDKGIAPLARIPLALNVELPNDYSIIIKDPEYGPMMYDAKIGVLDPEQ
ncbi:MAG: hypothetical protein ABW061_17310 [Polyangiaceae bacterium]